MNLAWKNSKRSRREKFEPSGVCGRRIQSGGEPRALHDAGARSEAGFTMVEIAFSLAIVAFALVAIMGVLPTGMTVQKDNREDTLINNDGYFWAETLRSGSRGVDDLTNYVEEIVIDTNGKKQTWVAAWLDSTDPDKLDTGEEIIGLLSTPKFQPDDKRGMVTNTVTARVRAINGPAINMRNPRGNEFVFRYQLESEVTPVHPAPLYTPGKNPVERRIFWTDYGTPNHIKHAAIATNLHNLRLTLRWPMFEQGNTWGVGRNRRTVRALVNGQVEPTEQDKLEGRTAYRIPHPNTYQYVSNEELPTE